MEYTEEESNQDIKIFETNPELDQSTSTTPNLLVSAEKVALVSFFSLKPVLLLRIDYFLGLYKDFG